MTKTRIDEGLREAVLATIAGHALGVYEGSRPDRRLSEEELVAAGTRATGDEDFVRVAIRELVATDSVRRVPDGLIELTAKGLDEAAKLAAIHAVTKPQEKTND